MKCQCHRVQDQPAEPLCHLKPSIDGETRALMEIILVRLKQEWENLRWENEPKISPKDSTNSMMLALKTEFAEKVNWYGQSSESWLSVESSTQTQGAFGESWASTLGSPVCHLLPTVLLWMPERHSASSWLVVTAVLPGVFVLPKWLSFYTNHYLSNQLMRLKRSFIIRNCNWNRQSPTSGRRRQGIASYIDNCTPALMRFLLTYTLLIRPLMQMSFGVIQGFPIACVVIKPC